MAVQHSRVGSRTFAFEPTPAVAASRARSHYVDCSVCRTDNSEYLFHRVGVRFVRCRTCGLVYVNPVGEAGRNYFDIASYGQHDEVDQQNLARDFDAVLGRVAATFERTEGRPIRRTLLVGRWLDAYDALPNARAVGLQITRILDGDFRAL